MHLRGKKEKAPKTILSLGETLCCLARNAQKQLTIYLSAILLFPNIVSLALSRGKLSRIIATAPFRYIVDRLTVLLREPAEMLMYACALNHWTIATMEFQRMKFLPLKIMTSL